jgi:hypothetical protein
MPSSTTTAPRSTLNAAIEEFLIIVRERLKRTVDSPEVGKLPIRREMVGYAPNIAALGAGSLDLQSDSKVVEWDLFAESRKTYRCNQAHKKSQRALHTVGCPKNMPVFRETPALAHSCCDIGMIRMTASSRGALQV